MKRPIKLFASILVVGLAAQAGTARANLLLNPSFEQPVLAPDTFQDFFPGDTIGAGWVVTAGIPGLLTQGDAPAGNFWPGPSDGNQYLFLDNSGGSDGIYQDVTLAAATAYQLTFDLAGFQSAGLGNPPGAVLNVDVTQGGLSVIGGAEVFTQPWASGYGHESLTFTTGLAGTYRLSLLQPDSNGTVVDNFDLVAASAVPEPSSAILAGMGALIGLGWMARRSGRSGRGIGATGPFADSLSGVDDPGIRIVPSGLATSPGAEAASP